MGAAAAGSADHQRLQDTLLPGSEEDEGSMEEDEGEDLGADLQQDTEMVDGTTSLSGGKTDQRGGAGKPRGKQKKGIRKGNGNTRSSSPGAGPRVPKHGRQ